MGSRSSVIIVLDEAIEVVTYHSSVGRVISKHESLGIVASKKLGLATLKVVALLAKSRFGGAVMIEPTCMLTAKF
jgi:hypothetical protein